MFGQKDFSKLELTVKNILDRITPAYIFQYYAGDFVINRLMSSPIRKDNKPSFIISDKSGRDLLFKDFSTGQAGNCFQFVMAKYGCNFVESLRIINTDFRLGLGDAPLSSSSKIKGCLLLGNEDPLVFKELSRDETSVKPIQIKTREWSQDDRAYWYESYGISKQTLALYNVKPISHFWLAGQYFKCKPKELTYAYDFGDGIFKLYSPFKESHRFIYNGSEDVIQGIEQLTFQNSVLIITKSLKDVMVFREAGIDAIAPQAESIVLKESLMNWLYDQYQVIITLADYDNAGIHFSWEMRRLYNTKPIFFTDKLWNRKKGYKGCKDASDFIKKYGTTEFRKLIAIRRGSLFPMVS